MAQNYDNIGKNLWTDHADDLSKFVLDVTMLKSLSILTPGLLPFTPLMKPPAGMDLEHRIKKSR